jgi:hypothetical protein
MNRGYLALYRKIQDHPFYKEKRIFSKYEAWIDLLIEARHKLGYEDVMIGMNVVRCEHGQSIKSLRTWGERWGWTAKKVSRFFNLLEKMGQIRHENVTVTTRITILNYKKYDIKCHTYDTDMSHDGNTSDTRVTHECPTDNNVKHDKHVNNEKNIQAPLLGGDGKQNAQIKKFIPPTIEEIAAYCEERQNGIDPVKFFNHYEASEWMRGKNKIKNWKACVVTWEGNQRDQLQRFPSTGNPVTDQNIRAGMEFLNE